MPVGGTKEIPIDIRVVTATHCDLRKLVESGKLREDLFYRLHVFPIRLPPLRERPEDIPALFACFKEKTSGMQSFPKNFWKP